MCACDERTYPRSVERGEWVWLAFVGKDAWIVVNKWNKNHIFIIVVQGFICATFVHVYTFKVA